MESSSSSSLSTIQSKDIPEYVKTIPNFNRELEQLIIKERVTSIFNQLRQKNQKKVPMQYLNDDSCIRRYKRKYRLRKNYSVE